MKKNFQQMILTAGFLMFVALHTGNALLGECNTDSQPTCQTSTELAQRDPSISSGNGGGGDSGGN